MMSVMYKNILFGLIGGFLFFGLTALVFIQNAQQDKVFSSGEPFEFQCQDSGSQMGSSPYTIITLSNFQDKMTELMEAAQEKLVELEEWLADKCTDPVCEKEQIGPTVNVVVEPFSSIPNSCPANQEGTAFSGSLCAGGSGSSCDAAQAGAMGNILTQIQGIVEMPDPCPSCSYYHDIAPQSSTCVESPPGSGHFTSQVCVYYTLSCGDYKTEAKWKGWIEWEAAFCCLADTCQDGTTVHPRLPGLPTPGNPGIPSPQPF